MAWLHFSRTVRNLALSAASTWYLGSLILSLWLWLWPCGSGFHVARSVAGGLGWSGQSCCEWLQNLSEGSRVLTWSPSSHSPSTAAIFFNDTSVIKCKLGTWHCCPSPILYFKTLPSAFCTGQPSTWPSPSCKRSSLSRGYTCHYSFSNWWSSISLFIHSTSSL